MNYLQIEQMADDLTIGPDELMRAINSLSYRHGWRLYKLGAPCPKRGQHVIAGWLASEEADAAMKSPNVAVR